MFQIESVKIGKLLLSQGIGYFDDDGSIQLALVLIHFT